jgi:hypothetical protein
MPRNRTIAPFPRAEGQAYFLISALAVGTAI